MDGQCACGFFTDRYVTWMEGVEICRASGARLPEIMSEEENAVIYHFAVSKISFKISFYNYF
jgi:hypothetical protein